MDTEYHGIALFLHSLCQCLALSQVANRQMYHAIKVRIITIAKKWNWSKTRAEQLKVDIGLYYRGEAPFDGGERDALKWWKNSHIDAQWHPLKALAITIHTIVPHATKIE